MLRPSEKTAVYIVADLLSGDIKIGVSIDPEKRCKQIAKTYSVGTVYLVSACWFESKEDAHKHEKSFHRMYRSRQSKERGGREWFSLTSTEVQNFIGAMEEYESTRREARGRYRLVGKGRKEGLYP
jgi:predicted GIY-YIG superfamily endonuclease